MDTVIERYCTVEESVKQSCEEIKKYEQGDIEFNSIDKCFRQWNLWAEEVKNSEDGSRR